MGRRAILPLVPTRKQIAQVPTSTGTALAALHAHSTSFHGRSCALSWRLEQACAYELTPGASGKFVLTLHTQSVAKNAPAAAPGKAPTPAIS